MNGTITENINKLKALRDKKENILYNDLLKVFDCIKGNIEDSPGLHEEKDAIKVLSNDLRDYISILTPQDQDYYRNKIIRNVLHLTEKLTENI
jgi:hypothetical protein